MAHGRPSVRALTGDESVLLRKLLRARRIGGAHLLEANLLRGMPRERMDYFREALRGLKRDGILQAKATAHGPAVSIPSLLVPEVHEKLRARYPDLFGP